MSKRKFDRKRPDIRLALAMGWEYVRHSSSGHLLFEHPRGGQSLTLSATLGGGRGDRNGIAWIRRNTPREGAA